MLTIEKTVLPSPEQWEIIIEGMRNPTNSWDKSDSGVCCAGSTVPCHNCQFNEDEGDGCTTICLKGDDEPVFVLGDNDHRLMTNLAKGGAVHAKYRRMIPVFLTINAPPCTGGRNLTPTRLAPWLTAVPPCTRSTPSPLNWLTSALMSARLAMKASV